MVPLDPGSDRGLARLLGHLHRQPAPPVPLDALLERWRRRRRRVWTAAGLSMAALALAAVVLPRLAPPAEPPVHLELRVVDVPADETGNPQDVLADVFGRPWEVRGP